MRNVPRPDDARAIVGSLLIQLDAEPITPAMSHREAQAAVMRTIHKLRTLADGEHLIYHAEG